MRRLINRLLVLALSLALIALAGVVIVEVVAALLGKGPVLLDWPAAARWAQDNTWGNPRVLAASLILLAAGLALVLGQLWPAATRRLRVDSSDPATDMAVTRRTVAADVTAAVRDVDGVIPQKVKVGRSRIAVRAATSADGDQAALADQVRAAVTGRLERLHLRRPPRLALRMSRRT